jgi:hypothetical protein
MSTIYYRILSKPQESERPHFFIQSHGDHAGRPLREPIANCFTVVAERDDDRELLFYTCRMLYLSKRFHRIIRGSVIPFIALYECKKVVREGIEISSRNTVQFDKVCETLAVIEKTIAANILQNKTLKEFEAALLQNYRR